MRLPEYQPNQVEPNILPTPHVSGAAPVAVGMERFGASLSSGEIAELARHAQAKADASVVMDAYVDFSKKAMALQTDALSKKGKEALAYDPYVEQFNSAYAETKGRLSPNQQFLFDTKVAHERINFETGLVRHAHEQGDLLNKENAAATVALEEQKLSVGYLDEANYDITKPESLINHLRASQADLLHMHGLSDNDPKFKEEMDRVTSKAYTDRVELLMTERPSEANDFFKKHESEIDPQQREALAKAVSHLSDEQQGIALARTYHEAIRNGTKTETEITDDIEEKTKDKPNIGKHALTEIHAYNAQSRADQITSTAVLGGKIETAIEKLEEKKIVSLADLNDIPEVKELEKLAVTNKVAATELERVKRYVTQSRRAQKTEIHQAQVEARSEAHFAAWLKSDKERKQKESKDDFMLSMRDPETLQKMSPEDIIQQSRENGLKYSQVNSLIEKRKQLIKEYAKDLKHNTKDTASRDVLNRIMENSGIPQSEMTSFGKAWRASIFEKENELKRPLTKQEIEEAGITGLQSHYESRDWGLFTTGRHRVWDMPAEKKPGTKGAIPSEVIHPKGGKGKLDAASARLFLGQVGWDGKSRPTQKQKDEAAAMAKQQGFEVE